MKGNVSIELPASRKASGENSMLSDPSWAVAITHHEHLLATHGKTFSFAARFFPVTVRHAVISLYAFFRTLDDLVDERGEGWRREDVERELDAWRCWFTTGAHSAAPREPLGTMITALQKTYQIPIALFVDFLDGLRTDLEPVQTRTFPELYHYCYQVAGTVGIAMSYLLGVRCEQAQQAAKQLGIAMQLTNILRDIGSDLALGRIYLPLSELERFGSSPQHLLRLYQAQQGPDERFRALMRYQIQRARAYYQEGLHGVWLLAPTCRLPILLAGRLYQNILTAIERRQYDVLRSRASTTWLIKLREAGIVFLLDLLWGHGEGVPAIELEGVYEE